MKNLFVVLFFIICIIVGVSLGIHSSSPQIAQQTKMVQGSTNSAFTKPPIRNTQASIGTPIKLSVPKIGLDSLVESVGQDLQGRMDVPKDPQNVGWYNQGFKPGEKGSAVIDGHLDTVTGAPAAFWSLSKLQQGDIVYVTDEKNNKHTFVVSQIETYDYNKVPMQRVFASTDKIRLNLITCRGIFDKQTKNYSKRIVVYAEGK